MKPVDAADYTIAVIGAGAMGQGIAQVAVQGGVKTLLFDARPGGAEAGREQIMKRIDRLVEKDRISADDAKAAGDRLGTVELPATTDTAPMTYMHEGVQYVVVSVSGSNLPGSFVALRLP